ncbi:MAG: 3-oxoacyl-[acyl-carrier-protein] synthase III C-terminal domain-containing protein [Dehalococcoidales bacterium]
MAGIVSYGAYVPLRRLSTGAQSEKAVAGWDEDSLTMAVAAAIDCLGGTKRETIDGLYFASTTPPYDEKLAATTAAWAIDLRHDILTADITDSLRAGTAALRMAADTIKAGSAQNLLVTASDLRLGAGGMDSGLGDGAAAFIIGDKDVIATIEGSYSISNELLDVWRASGAKNVRSWEDRFVFEEGYLKVLPQAIKSFMEKSSLNTKDITKAVFYGPDLRRHRQMAGLLGLKPEQVQEPFFDKLGNTGTAFTLMLLVAALEESKPGDKILVASYGDGADVLLLKVTDKIKNIKNKWGIKRSLASKMLLRGQDEYRALREFAAADPEGFGGASASVIARERDAIYALQGVKCLACGTVQYPPQRICTKCHTKDNFEAYSFADKKGKVFTFTLKYGADIPAFARPGVDTMVDFEGGGRALFGMTDMIADKVKVGMDVEMSFRTLGVGGGIHNYYWRCMPPRASWTGKE